MASQLDTPTDPLDVINMAQRRLGAGDVQSLDEGTEESLNAKTFYELARRSLLAESQWNFATYEEELAPLYPTPSYKYKHAHRLPTGCIRVWSVRDKSESLIRDYRIQQKAVVSNSDIVRITCVKDVVDVKQWSMSFTSVMVLKLAADMAYGTTRNQSTADALRLEYMQQLKLARMINASETPREGFDPAYAPVLGVRY